MRADNVDRYRQGLYADELVQANIGAIRACFDAAKQAGKDQKCSINVGAPGRLER